MSDDAFSCGDIVRLAGSSTRMVVHEVLDDDAPGSADGAYVCRWFNEANDLQEANFHAHDLIRVGAK